MKISFAFLAIVVVGLVGCSHKYNIVYYTRSHHTRPEQSLPAASHGNVTQKIATENGRLIFLTGRDRDGRTIVAATPPLRPSCAACHGANGAGGQKFPDGAVSADLRHSALVGKQKPPYTIVSLERAISHGIDNQGKPLDKVMPRWKLSQNDLSDVAHYVYANLK